MSRPTRRQREAYYARPWTGPTRRYDIVKEFVVALVVMALLTTGLAILFGSPDRKAITLQEWAKQAPADFVATAVAELNGTSGTATYGAPYTHDPSAGQKLLSLPLQRWGGVTEPIDTSQAFVVGPLTTSSDPAISGPLSTYRAAGADQQSAWATTYGDALSKAPDGDPAKVAAGDYGPVPALANGLLTMAQQGGLDGLIQEQGGFYQTQLLTVAAVPRRRLVPGGTGPRREPRRRPVGNDERDRPLPGTGVAMALHLLVPGPTV